MKVGPISVNSPILPIKTTKLLNTEFATKSTKGGASVPASRSINLNPVQGVAPTGLYAHNPQLFQNPPGAGF